jgi:hypothetical protein
LGLLGAKVVNNILYLQDKTRMNKFNYT